METETSEQPANLKQVNLGEREADGEKLEAKQLKIESVRVETIQSANNAQKAVFTVWHPDKTDAPIEVSRVKVEGMDGKLKFSGTWVKLDADNRLSKNSALGKFLQAMNAANLEATEGMTVPSVEDENGYLAFKAY